MVELFDLTIVYIQLEQASASASRDRIVISTFIEALVKRIIRSKIKTAL